MDYQIFVQSPKGLIQITSLQTNSKGIYYVSAHPNYWVCDTFGEYNVNTYYCEVCGGSHPKTQVIKVSKDYSTKSKSSKLGISLDIIFHEEMNRIIADFAQTRPSIVMHIELYY